MILRIENGRFAYKGGPEILKDINIEVASGEILSPYSGQTVCGQDNPSSLHDGHAAVGRAAQSLLDGEDIRKHSCELALEPDGICAAGQG